MPTYYLLPSYIIYFLCVLGMSSFVLWNQAEDIFLLIVSMFPGFGRVRIYLLKDTYLEII